MLTTLLTVARETPKWVKLASILVVVGVGCQKAAPEVKKIIDKRKQKQELKNNEA